jgi:hypothetical protein
MTDFSHIIVLKPAFMINISAVDTFLEYMVGNNAHDLVEPEFPLVETPSKTFIK